MDEADVKRVAAIYKKALQETGSPVDGCSSAR